LQYNTLTQTVRDAARYVAEDAGAGTGVIQLTAEKIATAKNLASYGTTGAGTAVLPGLSPADITIALVNGNNVTVSASYAYQSLFAGNIPALVGDGAGGGPFTMKAEIIMRVL
jgi:hypothetical protein